MSSATNPPIKGKSDHQTHSIEDTQQCTQEIHKNLRMLRLADSINHANAQVLDEPKKKKKKKPSFLGYTLNETANYVGYLIKSWVASIKKILLGGSLHPAELLPFLIFPVIAGSILFLILLWCIYARIPDDFLLKRWMHGDKKKQASHLFRKITKAQVDMAKEALSKSMDGSPSNENQRVFDLDIAKLCCQLSALMYSHNNNASTAFLEKRGDELCAPARGRADEKHKKKVFGFNSTIASGALGVAAPLVAPLNYLAEVTGNSVDATHKLHEDFAKEEDEHKQDSEIIKFCKSFGIEYAPISELNSSSAAYASLFWDPTSNWIIVAFKGTGPTDFSEWMTDLDYHLVYSGSWLKGFGKAHGGFAERIFPRDVKNVGGRRPYDTIAAAVKIVADKLAPHSASNVKKANIYFTGHSLGTAIASLAYARAVSGRRDFGKDAIVRDAYLFATPIICDVQSVHAFNFAMFEDLQKPRTMWRITNRNDVVAAGLPEAGDRPTVTNPNNLFTFAHLGTEIRMLDIMGEPCRASGNHITQGTKVSIRSGFDDYTLYQQWKDGDESAGGYGKDKNGMPRSDPWLDVPIIGSVLAHDVGNYWNSLCKVTNGDCEWYDD